MMPPPNNRQETDGVNIDISDLISTLKLGNLNSAIIAQQLTIKLQTPTESALGSSYRAAGGNLISSSPGYLLAISIVSSAGGTGTGLCYDSASVANAGSSNAFMVIPSSGYVTLCWPFQNGLVVQPSSQGTHTVAVSYV